MSTPLMRQYQSIKHEYPDAILLFRMGDFFETFEEDAIITSRVLGITLTRRSNGAASEVPLAGFPHHALDAYLPKLVRAGYRVAVCEQLEDPKLARGIVKRDVVEVVTPGVAFSEKLLDHASHMWLAAVVLRDDRAGLAFADASTGDFLTCELPASALRDEVDALGAGEILVSKRDADRFRALFGGHPPQAVLTRLDDWLFTRDVGYELLTAHFGTQSLKGFGVELMDTGIIAAGATVHYLKETQKAALPHLRSLRRHDIDDRITLDAATRRNLEITAPMADGFRAGTLIGILDRTSTSMGARLLKEWITQPLRRLEPVQRRLAAVAELVARVDVRERVTGLLREIADLERVMGRICTGRALPRDMTALAASLRRIPPLRAALSGLSAPMTAELGERLDPMLDVAGRIESALEDDPPATLADGGVIRRGFHPELDDIRDIALHGREWMAQYQERLRTETGISSLKLEFNRQFGFYINVSKANYDKVPSSFIRRQTLVNAERYTTPELQEYEDRVLHAKEQIVQLESELFNELRLAVSDAAGRVQDLARAVAELDCLTSHAIVADEYGYTCPEVNDGDEIVIEQGRHPVVERLLPPGERFVANDVRLSSVEQVLIITGPNMSGKSTYLRQTGLIVLLTQIGSFVPAQRAVIGLVDRIFTRVGASDNIAAGESTFLVEMQEAANILNNATARSLVLLDEIGRGTSTFDGISIAWAMTEYLHDDPVCRPRTMFATHYHELNEMADIFPRIRNYKVDVREYRDKVIFLRSVTPGTADHSYGIQVGKMAGLPDAVIDRAKDVLRTLEGQDLTVLAAHGDEDAPERQARRRGPMQISLFEAGDAELKDRLRTLDVHALSPVQAWQTLEELKRLAEGAPG